ncbi:MAG: hypothetical protein LUH21_16245 [Clostridiales bacterium]|nr:hypothetical protein [Clostridiales bacterium]
MFKRLAAVLMAGAMMVGGAMTAFASTAAPDNTQSVYFYQLVDGEYTVPRVSHPQDLIVGFDANDEGDIVLYVQDISVSMGSTTVEGSLTSMTIGGETFEVEEVTDDDGTANAVLFNDVDVTNEDGYIPVEIGMTMNNHPSNLNDGTWYLYLEY